MKSAAIIGLGDISAIHIGAIKRSPEIALTAVCDTDKNMQIHAPAGTAFYTNYHEMIEKERPDVVHVCLPHYLHVPAAKEAVLMGSHVFCEKPAAMNTAEALEFAAFEAAHPDRHICICLQNRLNESVEMLKEMIDSGRFGKVCGVKGIVPWARPKSYYEEKPWRGTWKYAGGGCMMNQSVHTLDLLCYLGGPVMSVKASVSQLLNYGIEVEDTVSAALQFSGGARGLFFATNANYKNEGVQISVQTEHAEFSIIDNVLFRIDSDGHKERLAEDAKMPGTKFYYGASHEKLIRAFYRAVENNSTDYLHVKDAVMSIRLIDAIQESGRTGQCVKIQTV